MVNDNGDDTYTALRVTEGVKMPTAHDAKLTGLKVASWTSATSTVYCDFESAINTVKTYREYGKSDRNRSANVTTVRQGNTVRKMREHA